MPAFHCPAAFAHLYRVYATKLLSHFTARFVPISPPVAEEAAAGASSSDDEGVTVHIVAPVGAGSKRAAGAAMGEGDRDTACEVNRDQQPALL